MSLKFSKTMILLAVSCLIWIGILSLAAVFIFGASASIGWIIAGTLFLGLIFATAVIVNEVLNASDLVENFNELGEEEYILTDVHAPARRSGGPQKAAGIFQTLPSTC